MMNCLYPIKKTYIEKKIYPQTNYSKILSLIMKKIIPILSVHIFFFHQQIY